MRNIAVAFCLVTLGFASFGAICGADDAAAPNPPAPSAADQAKGRDIRKLLELSGGGRLGVQVAGQIFKAFRQSVPQVPAEFWDECEKELNPEDMVNMVVPIYAKHFSDDEIKQLIAFYESPIGKKLAAEQPGIMTESMAVGQQWGQKIGAKVLERLRDKGYIPKT